MKAIIILLSCAAIGCAPRGMATHLTLPDIPFAHVSTTDRSLAGPVLSENDSTITIAAYGVAQTFEKATLKSIERDTVSDPTMVQQETLDHSAQAAGSATAILVIYVISLLAAAALITRSQ